jgi:hypothetical protein
MQAISVGPLPIFSALGSSLLLHSSLPCPPVVVRREESDGKVTAPQRRSVLSAISTIIREVVFKDPDSGVGDNETVVVPSPDPTPQLNSHRESQSEIQPDQKTRSETFVEGGDLSHRSPVEGVPDDLLEYMVPVGELATAYGHSVGILLGAKQGLVRILQEVRKIAG